MKNILTKSKLAFAASLAAASAVAFLAGCAGEPYAPVKSGFLSNYRNLKKVDDTTWRYVYTNRLAIYDKFMITSSKVLVKSFDGKPVTPEQQEKASAYLREAITKALGDRYPVVTTPGPDVGQIRVAITSAYKTGDQLGLTVEGEILDASSGYQVAAVMKSELGKLYLGDWWDSHSAKEIVNHWAERLREAVDNAHGK